MIDLHCHVLPGVDDGPATVEAAIDLARGAEADGITTIAATPHVDGSHHTIDSEHIRAGVQALQAHFGGAGLELTVVTGAEVAATRAVELDDGELRALTLGAGGWLLLECPASPTLTPGFTVAARRLVRRGLRVLLAHPERCPLFLRAPEELDELIAEGMLAQVTARSLSGRFGRTVRDCALHLVDEGRVHVVASDGHGGRRPARIASELAGTQIDPALVRWLTRDVPAAVLAGSEIPERPRPAPRRQRRIRRLLGRRRRTSLTGEPVVKVK